MENQGRFQPEGRGLASSPQRDSLTHSLKLLPASTNLILCIHTFCVPSAKQYNLYEWNRNKYPWNGFHQVKTISTMDRSQSRPVSGPSPWPHFLMRSRQGAVQETLEQTFLGCYHSWYRMPPNLLGADHAGLVAYDSAPNPDILRLTKWYFINSFSGKSKMDGTLFKIKLG